MALENISGFLFKIIINPLFWLLMIIGFLLGVFLILVIRKKRRLQYEAVEIVDLGSGKTSLNVLKCGWFGKKSYLRGLWWSGREVMKTGDGDFIENFSEEDYQEVNGKRGIVFYRDPTSRILVPINKLEINNKDLLATIPPAEFTDAAIDIVKDAEKETSGWKEKVIQLILWGTVIIFSLVAIIVIIQYVKTSQDKAAQLILDAGDVCLKSAKEICTDLINAPRGLAP